MPFAATGAPSIGVGAPLAGAVSPVLPGTLSWGFTPGNAIARAMRHTFEGVGKTLQHYPKHRGKTRFSGCYNDQGSRLSTYLCRPHIALNSLRVPESRVLFHTLSRTLSVPRLDQLSNLTYEVVILGLHPKMLGCQSNLREEILIEDMQSYQVPSDSPLFIHIYVYILYFMPLTPCVYNVYILKFAITKLHRHRCDLLDYNHPAGEILRRHYVLSLDCAMIRIRSQMFL